MLERLEDRCLLATSLTGIGAYGQLPLAFEANVGQTASQVNYLARGQGYTLFLTPTEAVLGLQQVTMSPSDKTSIQVTASDTLQVQLVGSNTLANVVASQPQGYSSNYIIGNDPSQWQTNVPNYGQVEYQNVYPGVNVVYYGNQSQLEYDFDVAPGADPSAITLNFSGQQGMQIDNQGNLILQTSAGNVVEQAPVAYQDTTSGRQTVASHFVLNANGQVSIAVGAYDTTQPLVIDPMLNYSTYLGGSGADEGEGIAVDSFGNAYVTGTTTSLDFPTAVPTLNSTAPGSFSVFVAKLNAAGTGFVYSTYYGGSGSQNATGIALDASGDAYIEGYTNSVNLPTTANAAQKTYGGGTNNVFVAELNPTGSALLYSTYLGGAGDDLGFGLAVDGAGNTYVTGSTTSAIAGAAAGTPGLFPTTSGAAQTTLSFANVSKTTTGGSLWATSNTGLADATIKSMVVDPTATNIVYAATQGNGVFQSTNGGTSWAALNAGLSGSQATMTINALTTDTAGNIFAATNAGVYELLKGTTTWVSLGNGLGASVVTALGFDASGNLFAGTQGSGVFKLEGHAWVVNSLGITNLAIQAIAGDPNNANVVYVGTAGGGVYKSLNDGANWQAVDVGLLDQNVVALVIDKKSGNLYAAGVGSSPSDGGVYVSSNGGTSWTAFNYGLLNTSLTSLAIDAADNVYAGTAAGIFKSTDGGVSWNIFNDGVANLGITALAADPTTASTVYAGANQTQAAFLTKLNTAAGGTGAILTSTLVAGSGDQQSHGVAIDSSGNAYLTGYTTSDDFPVTANATQSHNGDQKSFLSTDGGADWTDTDNGLPRGTIEAEVADPLNATSSTHIVYAGTEAGGVFKSTDGGNTWTAADNGLTNLTVNALAIAQTSATTDIIYAGTDSGVFVSTDQGATWTTSNALAGRTITALAVNTVTPSTVFAGTANSGVFLSTNSGSTWITRNSGLNTLQITTLTIDPTISTTVFAGTKLWGLYQSVNNGTNWQQANQGLPASTTSSPPGITVTAFAADPNNPGLLYLGLNNGGIGAGAFRSIDDGSTWGPLFISFSALNITALAVDPTTAGTVYAGTNNSGVFRSVNSGLDWGAASGTTNVTFNANRLTNYHVTALAIDPGNADVYGGFFQQLVPTSDAFVTVVNPAATSLVFSTYLGGNADDVAQGIALDPSNNIYITGYTDSGAYPILHPLLQQSTIHPGGYFGYDAFVTKLNAKGTLIYSTFLGGGSVANIPGILNPQGDDYGNAIAVDANGFANVTGNTTSTDFPVTNTAFQSSFGGGANQGDAFVARIPQDPSTDFTGGAFPNGLPPDYASYLGGGGDDSGLAIALDGTSNEYVTGFTSSTNFPTVNAAQAAPGGGTNGLFADAFIAKIVPIPITVTLNVAVHPSALGGQFVDVTLTAIISTTVTGGTGTAFTEDTFFDGNTSLGTGVSDGKGNQVLTIRGVPVNSTHEYYVWFGGDQNHLPAKSLPVQLVASTTQVTATGAGQSPTLTATVSPNVPGGLTPTGFVTFMVDGTVLPGQPNINPPIPGNAGVPLTSRGFFGQQYGIPLINGQASYTPPVGFTPGSYAITAVYSGDLTYLPSTAPALQVALPQTATASTLTTDVISPVFGQQVTLTAVALPLVANFQLPTGTIVFRDGTSVIGMKTLANGLAAFQTSTLGVGTHQIIAFYSGSPNYTTSSSVALDLTVAQAPSVTTVTTNPAVPTPGQPLTFTITVAAGALSSGTPTGSITLTDGLATLGSVPLVGGTATFTLPNLASGPHNFTATYNGDKDFLTSSGTISIVPTSTAVVSSENPAGLGDLVTYTATVTILPPGTGTATGTVTFSDTGPNGTRVIGVAIPLDPNGQAALTINNILGVGPHTITAVYNPSPTTFFGSSTGTVAQVYNKGTPVVQLSTGPNPAAQGSPVTLTAVVAPPQILLVPTGTVTFFDGTQMLGTQPLDSTGTAVLNVSTLTAGTHSITAQYSGDANYLAETSKSANQTILPGADITLQANPNPANLGQSVTFTVTAAPIPPTTATPTGSIALLDGSSQIASGTLQNGTVSFTIGNLTLGNHVMTATYGGDSTFAPGSSAPVTETVTKGPVTVGAGSSSPTIGQGQPLTLFATVTAALPTTPVTGTVAFLDGSTLLGTATIGSNGQAVLPISTLSPGTHSISASYSGDINNDPGQSPAFQQIVQPVPGVALTTSNPDSPLGEPITITVTVTPMPPETATPTGNVVLYDGSAAIDGGQLQNGTISFTISSLTKGVHFLTAQYSGDANYFQATSPQLTQNIHLNSIYVTGTDAGGGPQVTVYDAVTNQVRFSFFAYNPMFAGGVRVAVGDVFGNGIPDIITAPGPGGGPQISVYSGATGQLLLTFFAFNPMFSGGQYVAAGDVEGTGQADIVIGADKGGGPNVTVFNSTGTMVGSFFAYAATFTGGVRVAVGDVRGVGHDDIITAPGPGGAPQINMFDAHGNETVPGFLAFNQFFTQGFFVAAGDVNQTGKAQVIVSIDAGSVPTVGVYDPLSTLQLQSFYAYDPNFMGGVRVGVIIDGQGNADIITGSGPGGGPLLRIFSGTSDAQIDQFFAYDPNFSAGFFVAGGD
jgi:photosystem II stability/assembly factor-like uncharacterized protein